MSKTNSRSNSQPTKIRRTGEKTFNVHHDDGSIFECKADTRGIADKVTGGGIKKIRISGDVKAHNVMSNKDRNRLGVESDPELPD